jgi:hypothetical protein
MGKKKSTAGKSTAAKKLAAAKKPAPKKKPKGAARSKPAPTTAAKKAVAAKKPAPKKKPKSTKRNKAPTGLQKVLADATALIPPALSRDLQNVHPRLQKFTREGDYARWMDMLFKIGAVVEQAGRDAELPPDFWYNLAGAARAMQFPEFIPYAHGKAEGRLRRSMADVLAAIVVIHREIGERWPRSFPNHAGLLDEFVGLIAAVDPAYPKLLKAEGSSALTRRFDADRCGTDPSPDDWLPVRLRCNDVLRAMFDFVLAEDYPESLSEERWSVVNFNAFELRYPGLFPRAVPWWWPS